MPPDLRPQRLVLCAAPEDGALRAALDDHLSALERDDRVTVFHDGKVGPGEDRDAVVAREIAAADLIVLLISASFLASDACFTREIEPAIARHRRGEALVVLVLVRPVDWKSEAFEDLPCLPANLLAVTMWNNVDMALRTVEQGLRRALEARALGRPFVAEEEPDPPPLPAAPSTAEERALDAAIPARVTVGELTEVLAMVVTPRSGGLRALIELSPEAFTSDPSDVKSTRFELEFPRDAEGRPRPASITVALESIHFDPPKVEKKLLVSPRKDSTVCTLLVTPRREGHLSLQMELRSNDDVLWSQRLQTFGGHPAAAPAEARAFVVTRLPLSTESTWIKRTDIGHALPAPPPRPPDFTGGWGPPPDVGWGPPPGGGPGFPPPGGGPGFPPPGGGLGPPPGGSGSPSGGWPPISAETTKAPPLGPGPPPPGWPNEITQSGLPHETTPKSRPPTPKMGPSLLRRALVLLALLALLAALGAGIAYTWFHHRSPPAPASEELFPGVHYQRSLRTSPRPALLHVITIDLDRPGLRFLVTPGDPTRELPLDARTTSDFLAEFHAQIAINGDFFSPWYSNNPVSFYPHRGDPVKVDGPSISRGVRYGTDKEGMITLRFSRDARPSFTLPLDQADNAISGERLVAAGKPDIDSYHDVNGRQPRSAVGIDREEKHLFLFVIDGRQPSYSEGINLPDLAALAIETGAYNAMNLDGGGSSALVVEGPGGEPRQLNCPIHTRIPHRERFVGNHLGIFVSR
ncbi:MAG: phosphodiester glycosidase family protein [Byssovorax sp.]